MAKQPHDTFEIYNATNYQVVKFCLVCDFKSNWFYCHTSVNYYPYHFLSTFVKKQGLFLDLTFIKPEESFLKRETKIIQCNGADIHTHKNILSLIYKDFADLVDFTTSSVFNVFSPISRLCRGL